MPLASRNSVLMKLFHCIHPEPLRRVLDGYKQRFRLTSFYQARTSFQNTARFRLWAIRPMSCRSRLVNREILSPVFPVQTMLPQLCSVYTSYLRNEFHGFRNELFRVYTSQYFAEKYLHPMGEDIFQTELDFEFRVFASKFKNLRIFTIFFAEIVRIASGIYHRFRTGSMEPGNNIMADSPFLSCIRKFFNRTPSCPLCVLYYLVWRSFR